ncbi:MAG: hypothetical protein A2381_09545 [Bdellovibrionales bacterium RIFOXYB1_FULL_37_110]|nr:MAG: hypothetical protein A2417_02950 [Bdellovibrionales bacterium RIFOXYC1_FULL_37_79]OFZ59522.1 MAG: hypothetical protein A2381_09545 [Bdellovibrionales bacterium RIFOXYB1_FULL_37_110]OFZ64240.1 MAG: hypothetical protein A2577_12395 [Bdellovibrionales bacterium RIFOXYD1_FULL_36_51]
MSCPLCGSTDGQTITTQMPVHSYFDCLDCRLISMHKKNHLSHDQELARYLLHQNDVTDIRYQNFVNDVISFVQTHIPSTATGLDFGSGPGPVITNLLRSQGYLVCCYDPYFAHDPGLLSTQYDFIVSCEVVEHFYNPADEFLKLKQCLRPHAPLIIKTLLYKDSNDFSNWYYPKDPTHVCFYRSFTFDWIAKKYQFLPEILSNRLIILWNHP